MKFHRRPVKKGRIEVIPMIDAVLMLLIFYMTFGKFHKEETELGVNMPVKSTFKPQTEEMPRTNQQINVRVVGHDKVFVNDDLQGLGQFEVTLSKFTVMGDDVSVTVTGEKEALYQDVIDVLNVCARLKIINISFTPTEE